MISLNSPCANYPLSSRETKSPYSYKTHNFFQGSSTDQSIHSLEDQKIVVGTKLSKLEMRIKQLREAEKSKQAKLLARNLVEELLSIHEESFDVKRSLKDLVEISNKNEVSINKLQSSLKNSSLNPTLKMSTTKKIQHLLEEIEKSKDIEKRLVGVLKKNENEQQELKSIIIDSTIEKNLNDSLVFEHKTLQLEKEMIQLRINNLEIQREKDLQFERVKLELKDTKLQLQKALSEICEFKTSKPKHRDIEPLENNFLTPKSSTKYIANTTKPATTAHKQKPEQAPSFRFLAKNFETSKTPNSKYEEKSDNDTTSALKKASKSKTLTLDTNDQIKLPHNHPLKDILRPHRENSNPDALRLLPPQTNLTSKSKSPMARVTKNELNKIISPKNVEIPTETTSHHSRPKGNHSMDQNSNFESHNRRESYKLNDRKLPEKPKINLLTPTPKNFDRTCPPQILTQKTPNHRPSYPTTTDADHSYYKYKTLNPDFEKKSPYSTKMRANPIEDNDTCLIGSVTQVDFENQVSDHLAANLLKDISNTTRPAPEIDQFNFKLFENKGAPNSSDKENRNFRFLEDSDKKNPLEMEFED